MKRILTGTDLNTKIREGTTNTEQNCLYLFVQEIYRPGTAISHASNMCTAVGGDQNKEFMGNASFLREKGPRGGIRIFYI